MAEAANISASRHEADENMMDRIKRTNLSNDRRIQISRMLQLNMLEEIGRVASRAGLGEEIIFHGGTSLNANHGSLRWSEDLDFMASPKFAEQLFGSRRRIEAALKFRASLAMPGSVVDLIDKTPESGRDLRGVDRMLLRWEHPAHVGAVKVKVELYLCDPDVISAYMSEPMSPRIEGLQSRAQINSATLVSIWADKIVAMAQRPALKHRDMHDLGYILPRLDPAADRDAALGASMAVYDRSAKEIRMGLMRDIVLEGIEDKESFADNMANWFSESEMSEIREAGALDRLYDAFRVSFAQGVDLVDKMAGHAPDASGGLRL